LCTAFAVTPERFVRGVPIPPALPQAVWINQPWTLAAHAPTPVDLEPGERVARPTVGRSALVWRTLDGEVSSSSPRNGKEQALAVAQ
jgi:hypothetical protein